MYVHVHNNAITMLKPLKLKSVRLIYRPLGPLIGPPIGPTIGHASALPSATRPECACPMSPCLEEAMAVYENESNGIVQTSA